jgi:O-antigen/teichoic acid export membrane protein
MVAGIIGIGLALLGAGAWALAVKYVVVTACTSLFLWITNPWYPKKWIDRRSFAKLFGFGSQLAASSLLNQVFENIYRVVIGKKFAATMLGFFTQAQNFQNVASQSLVGMFEKVTYPILAKAKEDPTRLKRGYRSLIQVSSFIIFPAMVGMALTAEPLILTLVGEKWRPTIPFLQLLCISGSLHHLHSINLNVLKVVGRTDLFLRLEIVKKTNIAIAIAIGLRFGIWGLLVGHVISSYVALFINMYYTRSFIDYSIPEQLRDIVGVLWLSAPMACVVYLVGSLGFSEPVLQMVTMVLTGVAAYVMTGVLARAEPLISLARVAVVHFPALRRGANLIGV